MVCVIFNIFSQFCIQYVAGLEKTDTGRHFSESISTCSVLRAATFTIHDSAKPDVEEELMTLKHLPPTTPPARSLLELQDTFYVYSMLSLFTKMTKEE